MASQNTREPEQRMEQPHQHPEGTDPNQLRQLVEKIKLSKPFRKVPIQRELLAFLVEECIAGRILTKAVGIVHAGLIPPARPQKIMRRSVLGKRATIAL